MASRTASHVRGSIHFHGSRVEWIQNESAFRRNSLATGKLNSRTFYDDEFFIKFNGTLSEYFHACRTCILIKERIKKHFTRRKISSECSGAQCRSEQKKIGRCNSKVNVQLQITIYDFFFLNVGKILERTSAKFFSSLLLNIIASLSLLFTSWSKHSWIRPQFSIQNHFDFINNSESAFKNICLHLESRHRIHFKSLKKLCNSLRRALFVAISKLNKFFLKTGEKVLLEMRFSTRKRSQRRDLLRHEISYHYPSNEFMISI